MDSAGRWLALRFTKRHWAPWTRSRQQIGADLKAAWSNDPAIGERPMLLIVVPARSETAVKGD